MLAANTIYAATVSTRRYENTNTAKTQIKAILDYLLSLEKTERRT